jgi:pilus assembly protein TadC
MRENKNTPFKENRKVKKRTSILTQVFIFIYLLILLVFVYLIYRSIKYNGDFPTIYFAFTIGVVILYNYLIPKILPHRGKFLDFVRYICNVFYILCWIYIYMYH